MGDVQGTYKTRMDVARAGMLGNMAPVDLISRTLESAAGADFGVVVQQGTADNGCKVDLTGMTFDTFLGITVREYSVRPETPNKFAQYESVRVLRKGPIWVTASKAVTAGTDVTVALANGALNSDAVGAGQIAINGRWETSTAGAGLALLVLR